MQPSSLQFSKMHGLGNDFVVINAIDIKLDLAKLPIRLITDRHRGIGCDQLLIVEASTEADFFCRIINADGSEAEQCGNGLRCVARFVHEAGLTIKSSFTIETVAGIFPVEIKNYDHIRVALKASAITSKSMMIPLPQLETAIEGSSLSMGNPHFIIKVDDISSAPTTKIGPLISTNMLFPEGTNVGFVQVVDRQHIRLRTYERGSGETHACGSNAAAAVAAGILDGSLAQTVNVEFKYGQLIIEWEGGNKPVYMTGPATFVFAGVYSILTN